MLDFKGVNLAIMHFVTQYTHVSRHFTAWNKKNSLGKTENVVSEIHKNNLFFPYNPQKIRNAFMFVSF